MTIEIENSTPLRVFPLTHDDSSDRPGLSVILKGTFSMLGTDENPFAAEQLPIAELDEYNNTEKPISVKFESDLVPFKPKADIILVGKAYAPHGQPVANMTATLAVGNVSRSIMVFGDRNWIKKGKFKTSLTMTQPQEFTEMELIYERAFGGTDLNEDYQGEWSEENPIGRGFIARKRLDQAAGKPLPNLENPEELIGSWKDRPAPVGFGCYGRGWRPRVQFAGTYDEEWQLQRSPKPPLDFKEDYYNCAHPQLQLAHYLSGNERVVLTKLSHRSERVLFRLPGLAPRIVVRQQQSTPTKAYNGLATKDVSLATNLDTLFLIPEEDRYYLVWRGRLPLSAQHKVVRISITLHHDR